MSQEHLAPEARPHAYKKAQEIAKALGPEWSAMPSHHEETMDVAWMAYLHGPAFRALTLNMGTWRNGRLTILGSCVRLQKQYHDPRVSQPHIGPMPTISVDPFKDGETIAKDIRRRLLSDYEQAYELAAENLAATERSAKERARVAEELIQLTGGKLSPNFPFSIYTRGQNLNVDYPDSISFSHNPTFTLDQMRRIIAAVPELFK